MLVADLEGAGDGVERVGVDDAARRHAVRVDAAEVDRARVDEAHPGEAAGRQRDQVLVAEPVGEVDRRVDQRVGPLGQHRPPALEVALDRLLVGEAVPIDVVVHDGRAGLDAGQRLRGDLGRLDGTFGLSRFDVSPLMATSMMTG